MIQRNRCVSSGLALLVLAGAAGAREPSHHYDISGGLSPMADAGNTLRNAVVTSHLAPEQTLVTQKGEGFELAANLVASPSACATDTIFEDGFDP